MHSNDILWPNQEYHNKGIGSFSYRLRWKTMELPNKSFD